MGSHWSTDYGTQWLAGEITTKPAPSWTCSVRLYYRRVTDIALDSTKICKDSIKTLSTETAVIVYREFRNTWSIWFGLGHRPFNCHPNSYRNFFFLTSLNWICFKKPCYFTILFKRGLNIILLIMPQSFLQKLYYLMFCWHFTFYKPPMYSPLNVSESCVLRLNLIL